MSPRDTRARLIAELDRVSRDAPFDRKVLVCRRPAEGRELLRSLALSGRAWVGWDTWSLRQFAHEVVASGVAAEGLSTADAFDVMALVDEAIDAAEAAGETGPFGGPVPGVYRDPIRRSVEALRAAGIPAATLRASAGADPKLRMLAGVVSSYEAGLADRGLVDGAGLLGLAADRVAEAGRSALPDARLYLLPGLSLRGEEGRLVRGLTEHGAEVLATDAVPDLSPPAGLLWSSSPPAAAAGASAGAAGPGGLLASLDLFAAATPTDELREVIRRVLSAGIPWDRVEIVATDAVTYGTALHGLSRRLDIPVTYSRGLPLSRTRVGRVTDAYFRWIDDGFPVEPIRRLLETDDLGLQGSPALARRLRRLRIGWGHERYLPAVDRALSALDRAPPPRDGDGDEDALQAARDRERAELESLRGLLSPILAATPNPGARHAADTARTSPARLAEGLLAVLDAVPTGDLVENTARGVLVERLERARATLRRETGWRAATGVLRSRLRTEISPTAEGGRLAPWTSAGGHLHLSDLSTGGFAGRPYTFVVGLAAGALGAGGHDPLLTERDRARLNATLPGATAAPPPLPSPPERLAELKHELAAMMARLRGHVTLSHAAWDMTEGRTIGPAPELLQALRARHADPSLTYEHLRRHLGRLACAVPHAEEPLTGASPGAIDAADVWLSALARPGGGLRDGGAQVRALHPGLDAGLAAAAIRRADRVTAHHGLVTPGPELDPRTGDAVVSASRLETLGKCPLQYFYRYVVGVRPVRDPSYDPERWLDALERGSLLHAVYERALGERPADMDYADAGFEDHVARILDDEVARTLHRLPAPNQAALRAERDALEADARSFIVMVREQRPDVVRTELAFGPDPDADGEVDLALPGGRLRLRGRVDRLDSVGAGALHVVDYKTGRAFGYRDTAPFDGGRRLQHLLYAMAVEHLQPDTRVAAAEYHFPTVRGENTVVRFRRDDLAAGPAVLTTLLDLARDGRFLPTTSANDCRICDFGPVCRVRIGARGGAWSPRANWAKDAGSGLPEYATLVQLRDEHGGRP